MKKLFSVFYLLNILFSIIIFINILFLAGYSSLSIPIFIGVLLFYIGMLFIYFRNNREVTKSDIFLLSLYALLMMVIIVLMIYYQSNNNRTFNLLYFSKILLVPSLFYILCNIYRDE